MIAGALFLRLFTMNVKNLQQANLYVALRVELVQKQYGEAFRSREKARMRF
ncbi:MAG: hypothetical protein K2K93_12095 [Muribaculaceae bacterium]|nr:hypothetical protein [Muribaculaceae bacterium]